MKLRVILKVLLSLPLLSMLASCGDGKDSISAVPDVPATGILELDFGVKSLNFNWSTVAGASYYKLLTNSDGVSGFTQVGGDLTATNLSLEIAVHQQDWSKAEYLLQACNDKGCSDSAVVSVNGSVLDTIGYFEASNAEEGDSFGHAVVISADGSTLAVGAPRESSAATGIDGDQADSNAGVSGAVYIFVRRDNVWSQQAYIKASNTGSQDLFGGALALSADGDTLAVGAEKESSSATGIDGDQDDNSADFSGAVYVFSREDMAWSQQAYIKASNSENDDRFGGALSLSGDGNTLAVGARGEDGISIGINGDQDNNSATDSGAAYIFNRSGTLWRQHSYLKASNTDGERVNEGKVGDSFGNALALSSDGDTLAVAARWEDSASTGINGNQSDNSAQYSGAVYVFTFGDNSWSQQAYVKASNTEGGNFYQRSDAFGDALAMSADGDTLAVGASYESSAATGIDGDQSDRKGLHSGAVYIFSRSQSIWSQQAYVKASNTGGGRFLDGSGFFTKGSDHFGVALALSASGDTLAVGAFEEDSAAKGVDGDQADNSAEHSGAVYIFSRNQTTWNQQSYVKASNTETRDHFGHALALNGDGETLAVGADGRGAVYLY